MRLGKRWVWRFWVVALSAQAPLAFSQDTPQRTRATSDPSLVVAAVATVPQDVRKAIMSDPVAQASVARAVSAIPRPGFESTSFPSFSPRFLEREASAAPPLAWISIVHSSFVGIDGGEQEYRNVSMMRIAVMSVPSPHRPNFIERGFDAAMGGLDGSVRSLMRLVRGYPFDGAFDPITDDPSLTDSFLSIVERPARQDGSMGIFLTHLFRLEAKFLQRFQGSYLNPVSVELGYDDYDENDILNEQFKVVFDATVRTLIERSGFESMTRRVNQEGFDVWKYRGKDYYILPPVIAALLYYRGLDYRMKVGKTKMRLQVAPAFEVMDSLSDRDHLIGAVGLEVQSPIKGVKILTFAGLREGRMELDFIGIGTDLEIARKALVIAFSE